MASRNLICKEIMGELLEKLSTEPNEKTRRENIRNYLEDIIKQSNSNVINDFKKGLEWINVKEPLSFKSHLKGKIVLLDFFTYCCINCMHILPDLKVLENQFKVEDGLVVIGVHSPKFSNEKKSANVAAAVERYEIAHAVVNDPEESTWDALGIVCWPTIIVVGPNGEILLEVMGEGHRALLQLFIDECITFFKQKDQLSQTALPQIVPFHHSLPSSARPLSYPGKVIVSGEKIAIADTGNHRIIIANTSGIIEQIIGGPDSGFCDGDLSDAKFHSPQGLAFYTPSVLEVADTENHAIREINFTTRQVKTLVGCGEQGNDRHGGKLWIGQSISSPWDVCFVQTHVMLIAMAGNHQIWALFLDDNTWWKNVKYTAGTCVAIAGSGREENRNNSYPMTAGFAQPSGLCYSSSLDAVFIADSESSTVRKLNMKNGQVSAVVGGAIDPKNLFGFGDIDGKGTEAKLQHPLGVAWNETDKILYIADTYNHKIKSVDPSTNYSKTLVYDDCLKQLKEPAGLCVGGDNLYIADTNNHTIKVFNLKSKTTNVLILQSASKPQENTKVVPVISEKNIQLPPQGGHLTVKVEITLAEGISLTPGAPSKWHLHFPDDCNCSLTNNAAGDSFTLSKEWKVKFDKCFTNTKNPNIQITCYVFYCVKDVCSSQKFSFNVHISEDETAPEINHCSFNHVIS